MQLDGSPLLSFKQTRAQLDCGATKLYSLLQGGALRGKKIHSRWYVSEVDIKRYLRRHPDNRRRVI